MKRAVIVHGWDSYPEDGWFPWLTRELEARGFEVLVPAMPEPGEPKVEAWVRHLAEAAGEVDGNTILVGHSIGCQTILRYLERLPEGRKVGGVVLVAGWLTLTGLETEEERQIAKPWLETPIDFEKVRARADGFFALFSDNDRFVPFENKEMFERKLGARTAVARGKGHFAGVEGVTEIPVVLEEVLKL